VVRKLMETFNQDEVDMMYAASVIETTRCSPRNSSRHELGLLWPATFGQQREDAINVAGYDKVRALVIAASLGEGFL
jgi:hypothetical protein